MRKTALLITGALLVTAPGYILAQSAAADAEFNPNGESPFVRLIRPDRPGQTITTNMLYPGHFQLETGLTRYDAGGNASYAGRQV